jgi:hypothetical protein
MPEYCQPHLYFDSELNKKKKIEKSGPEKNNTKSSLVEGNSQGARGDELEIVQCLFQFVTIEYFPGEGRHQLEGSLAVTPDEIVHCTQLV